jgi:hypothetical protein
MMRVVVRMPGVEVHRRPGILHQVAAWQRTRRRMQHRVGHRIAPGQHRLLRHDTARTHGGQATQRTVSRRRCLQHRDRVELQLQRQGRGPFIVREGVGCLLRRRGQHQTLPQIRHNTQRRDDPIHGRRVQRRQCRGITKEHEPGERHPLVNPHIPTRRVYGSLGTAVQPRQSGEARLRRGRCPSTPSKALPLKSVHLVWV